MGGTNNIGTTSMQGVLLVGYAAGSNGTFLLSGGTVTVNGFDNIGSAGFGTFSQTGGAQTIGTPAAPGGLALGHAEYDLSGTGVLNVNGTVLVRSPTSIRMAERTTSGRAWLREHFTFRDSAITSCMTER
jgi:hypothetical protein